MIKIVVIIILLVGLIKLIHIISIKIKRRISTETIIFLLNNIFVIGKFNIYCNFIFITIFNEYEDYIYYIKEEKNAFKNMIYKSIIKIEEYRTELLLIISVVFFICVISMWLEFYNVKKRIYILIILYIGFIMWSGYYFGNYYLIKYAPRVKFIGETKYVPEEELESEFLKSFSWIFDGEFKFKKSIDNTYDVKGRMCSGEELKQVYGEETELFLRTILGDNYDILPFKTSVWERLDDKDNLRYRIIIGIKGFYNFPRYIGLISMIQFIFGKIFDIVVVSALAAGIFKR